MSTDNSNETASIDTINNPAKEAVPTESNTPLPVETGEAQQGTEAKETQPIASAEDQSAKAEEPPRVEIEAYWVERKRYIQVIRRIPELRRRYIKAILIYLLRRFLWSFTFFPVFIAFWVPLVLNRFNPVAMVQNLLPSLQAFVEANPQSQAATIETLFIAWFSIGFTFAVFDFILTPFKSPYEYEADVHMRAWEELHLRNKM